MFVFRIHFRSRQRVIKVPYESYWTRKIGFTITIFPTFNCFLQVTGQVQNTMNLKPKQSLLNVNIYVYILLIRQHGSLDVLSPSGRNGRVLCNVPGELVNDIHSFDLDRG